MNLLDFIYIDQYKLLDFYQPIDYFDYTQLVEVL